MSDSVLLDLARQLVFFQSLTSSLYRDHYCIASGISSHIPGDDFINHRLCETHRCIPPDDKMIRRVKRLVATESCGEPEDSLEIQDYPSNAIFDGLTLSRGDVEAWRDLVLIASYKPEGHPNGYGPLHCREDAPIPTTEDLRLATVIFNVVADYSQDDDSGVYRQRDDPDDEYLLRKNCPRGFLVAFSAYCILKTVAPQLEPSDLYQIFASETIERDDTIGHPKAVEYGPITKSWGREAAWMNICGSDDSDAWWVRLLCCSKRTDEEILEEAWDGGGNLWVYVRPDRFPIADTIADRSMSQFSLDPTRRAELRAPQRARLDNLPLELLFVICQQLPVKSLLNVLSLNMSLRETLFPSIDDIAYNGMANLAPWCFPSKPIKTQDGSRTREDLEWWETTWRFVADIGADEIRKKAPWMKYWIECTRSRSMRNRKRIWRAAEGIRDLALALGFMGQQRMGDTARDGSKAY